MLGIQITPRRLRRVRFANARRTRGWPRNRTKYDYDFDALGNVTKKTDLGTGLWSYDPVRKYQLLSAAGGAVTYSYDANGNAITRSGQSITWTSYNYPSRIRKSSTEYDDFFYGPNRERWKQIFTGSAGTETTIGLGKLLEKVTSGGVIDWRHYLFAGEQLVAVYSRQSSGSNTVRYPLVDHQGSIAAVASSTGTLIVNESFAPFGQRRNGTTWQLPISGTDQTTIDGISRRGYTEHTHLGGAPLIHMNGRVQDPLTGRFLSADPYVASPMSTQGWNRYSYVENSPATFADPSGFEIQSCRTVRTSHTYWTREYRERGRDGEEEGGYEPVPHTVVSTSTKCRDIPEGEVLPRSDLDTPTCGLLGGGGDGGRAARAGCYVVNDPNISAETKRNVAIAGVALMLSGSAAFIVPEFLVAKSGIAGIETTLHGAGRVAGAAATRGGVLTAEEIAATRATGVVYEAARNGTIVHVVEVSAGRYNVVVDSAGKVVTTLKNIPYKELIRSACNYNWFCPL